MEGDSSVQRWVSPALASGLVLGAVGLGLALYRRSNSNSAKKKGETDQTKGTFSSLYTSKPKSNVSASSASSSHIGSDSDMKGYKTNSKGQKTTYFNRELSEEEKKLIGDITPKKIDASATSFPSSSPRPIASPSTAGSGESAWNTAGTWEEKDVTDWATDALDLLLRTTTHDLPGDESGKVSIISVQKIEGDATVSMIRGKKKYLYDLSTSVRWKLNFNDTVVTGDMHISEISADATHEFNVQGIDITPGGIADKKKINEVVKLYIHSDVNSLKSSITTTLQRFYMDMKSKF